MMLKRSFIDVLLLFGLILPVACSLQPKESPLEILPGSYQMDAYLPLVEGKKVGVVVNHTSLVSDRHLIDTLTDVGVNLVKVYSPEHGFKGTYDAGAEFEEDSTFQRSEFELISLYGSSRKPSVQNLGGIDVMLFDLQDVGVRFFTYISTLHYVMEACAEQGIPVVVLDRPNPNRHYIDGPVLELENQSFVGMHPVPIVYGMSIGEYAQMINGQYWLADSVQCDLLVIPNKNYDHNSRYVLPVAPSPNLPDMSSVYWYPSTCLFEGTVVSEGRGTDAPFRIIGHPDFTIGSFTFTPRSIPGASMNPKLKGEQCYGINLSSISVDSLQNRNTLKLTYLLEFYRNLNKGEDFFIDYMDLLAGTKEFREQVVDGWSEDEIRASWQEALDEYKKIRANYLLYPDFE